MIFGDQVDDSLKRALQKAGLTGVDGAFAFDAGKDLDKPGLAHRRRTRLELADDTGKIHELYLKRYDRPAAGKRLRRLIFERKWRSEAMDEFLNIEFARRAGVPTMSPVAADCDGGRGFIIVTSVNGDALERCGDDFLARHDSDGRIAELTHRLAELIKKFHFAGLVHRDLYSAHVFLHENAGEIELSLIDLARAFRPRWRKFRWRVKDLAQLKFSMPAVWAGSYWRVFLADYLSADDEDKLNRWNKAIDAKVAAMSRRAKRKKGG